jgi:hypothetical protein
MTAYDIISVPVPRPDDVSDTDARPVPPCPSWCDPDWCSTDDFGVTHSTAPLQWAGELASFDVRVERSDWHSEPGYIGESSIATALINIADDVRLTKGDARKFVEQLIAAIERAEIVDASGGRHE